MENIAEQHSHKTIKLTRTFLTMRFNTIIVEWTVSKQVICFYTVPFIAFSSGTIADICECISNKEYQTVQLCNEKYRHSTHQTTLLIYKATLLSAAGNYCQLWN